MDENNKIIKDNFSKGLNVYESESESIYDERDNKLSKANKNNNNIVEMNINNKNNYSNKEINYVNYNVVNTSVENNNTININLLENVDKNNFNNKIRSEVINDESIKKGEKESYEKDYLSESNNKYDEIDESGNELSDIDKSKVNSVKINNKKVVKADVENNNTLNINVVENVDKNKDNNNNISYSKCNNNNNFNNGNNKKEEDLEENYLDKSDNEESEINEINNNKNEEEEDSIYNEESSIFVGNEESSKFNCKKISNTAMLLTGCMLLIVMVSTFIAVIFIALRDKTSDDIEYYDNSVKNIINVNEYVTKSELEKRVNKYIEKNRLLSNKKGKYYLNEDNNYINLEYDGYIKYGVVDLLIKKSSVLPNGLKLLRNNILGEKVSVLNISINLYNENATRYMFSKDLLNISHGLSDIGLTNELNSSIIKIIFNKEDVKEGFECFIDNERVFDNDEINISDFLLRNEVDLDIPNKMKMLLSKEEFKNEIKKYALKEDFKILDNYFSKIEVNSLLYNLSNTTFNSINNINTLLDNINNSLIKDVDDLDKFKEEVDEINNLLKSELNNRSISINEYINNINNNLSSRVDTLNNYLDTNISELNSSFTQEINYLNNNTSFALNNLSTYIYNDIKNINENISDINIKINDTTTLINNDIDDINENISEINKNLNSLDNNLSKNISSLYTNVSSIIEDLNESINATIILINSSLSNAISNLSSDINDVLTNMSSNINSNIDDISKNISDIYKELINITTEMGINISDINNSVNNSLYELNELIDDVNSSLSDYINEINKDLNNIINNATDEINNDIDTLNSSFTQEINNLTSIKRDYNDLTYYNETTLVLSNELTNLSDTINSKLGEYALLEGNINSSNIYGYLSDNCVNKSKYEEDKEGWLNENNITDIVTDLLSGDNTTTDLINNIINNEVKNIGLATNTSVKALEASLNNTVKGLNDINNSLLEFKNESEIYFNDMNESISDINIDVININTSLYYNINKLNSVKWEISIEEFFNDKDGVIIKWEKDGVLYEVLYNISSDNIINENYTLIVDDSNKNLQLCGINDVYNDECYIIENATFEKKDYYNKEEVNNILGRYREINDLSLGKETIALMSNLSSYALLINNDGYSVVYNNTLEYYYNKVINITDEIISDLNESNNISSEINKEVSLINSTIMNISNTLENKYYTKYNANNTFIKAEERDNLLDKNDVINNTLLDSDIKESDKDKLVNLEGLEKILEKWKKNIIDEILINNTKQYK